MSEDLPLCAMCGDEFTVEFGLELTRYCNLCAQERVEQLEHLIGDHLAHEGICDSADDDGESLVCGSDLCTYCALVRAIDGEVRE